MFHVKLLPIKYKYSRLFTDGGYSYIHQTEIGMVQPQEEETECSEICKAIFIIVKLLQK